MTSKNPSGLPPLIIFHSPCFDGSAAAWVANQYFKGDCELFLTSYGKEPPTKDQVYGRDVYILDFSYSAEIIEELAANAQTVTLLDHHETAFKNLNTSLFPDNVSIILNNTRSGCMLTWDFFNTFERPPELLQYVEDRDLWQFHYPETKAIMAAVGAHGIGFDDFSQTISTYTMKELEDQGTVLLLDQASKVEAILSHAEETEVNGVEVMMVNCPHFLASEVGEALCKAFKRPAITWYYKDGTIYYSVRSMDDLPAANLIAEAFGGGGHRNAAGFKKEMPLCLI